MEYWSKIKAWRKQERATLLAKRVGVLVAERERLRGAIEPKLRERLPDPAGRTVGCYWPFKGEVDLRPLLRELIQQGARAALPVVVEKAWPLEFWHWEPGIKLARGIWNIPIPAERRVVEPDVLLVPLLGFDEAGYRLGYGGGYYDRTLAVLPRKPLLLGVGYELGRLATIHPQPHDIPMDAIVTEARATDHRQDRAGTAPGPR